MLRNVSSKLLQRSTTQKAAKATAATSKIPQLAYEWEKFVHQDTYRQSVEDLLSDPAVKEQRKAWNSKVERYFRLENAMQKATPNDLVIAVQEKKEAYSYKVMKGMGSKEISLYIVTTPVNYRHYHVLTGRPNVPCDFFADIDMPLEGPGHEKKILKIIEIVNSELAYRNMVPTETILLTGNSAKKHSYHLHIRCEASAFFDFSCVRRLTETVNRVMGSKLVDEQQTRRHGQLRLMLCPKYDDPSRFLTPAVMKDTGFAPLLRAHTEMSAPAMLELSLVTRQAAPNLSLCKLGFNPLLGVAATTPGATAATTSAHDECAALDAVAMDTPFDDTSSGGGSGGSSLEIPKCTNRQLTAEQMAEEISANDIAPRHLKAKLKWTRYRDVCRRIASLPAELADDYETWVCIGLSLYSFSNDQHALNTWINFSRKAPTKFEMKRCVKKWEGSFPKKPNNHTWRRGFNFIMHTTYKKHGV